MRWRWWTSRAELRAEAEKWERRCRGAEAEAMRAHAMRKAARLEMSDRLHELGNRACNAEQQLAALRAKLRTDGEPGRRGCEKVRLHGYDEAERWRIQVERETGASLLRVYRCKVCPRSPVTMQRYFHVGHAGNAEAQAAKQAEKQARVEAAVVAGKAGTTLAQRIDPRSLAALAQLRGARKAEQ